MACRVDSVRAVQLNVTVPTTHRHTTTNSNSSNVTAAAYQSFFVYYEYVRSPCVELSYYNQAVAVTSRGGKAWNSYPLCADPRAVAAQCTCCGQSSWNPTRAKPVCVFHNERMTMASAQQRCEAVDADYKLCAFDYSTGTGLGKDDGFAQCDTKYSSWATGARFWTTYSCSLLTTIASDGTVALSHNPFIPFTTPGGYESFVPLSTSLDRLFRVHWNDHQTDENGNDDASSPSFLFPSVAGNACGAELGADCLVVSDGDVGGGAGSGESSCVCNTSVVNTVVFPGPNQVPTVVQVLRELRIGALDPLATNSAGAGANSDGATFVLCATAVCNASSLVNTNTTSSEGSTGGVRVWFRKGTEAAAGKGHSSFDSETVFELLEGSQALLEVMTPPSSSSSLTSFYSPAAVMGKRFFLNRRSTVAIMKLPSSSSSNTTDTPSFSFRNPPRYISKIEPTKRDAEHEVEELLSMYLAHQNVGPFVALRLIQRLVTSNPSPRYVLRVAQAFRTGTFHTASTSSLSKNSSSSSSSSGGGSSNDSIGDGDGDGVLVFGSGARGDLSATVAAILCDPEARSSVLDLDPSHGGMREPLLKVLHLMRSMEFKASRGHEEVLLRDEVSQFPYYSPTVFNFYEVDYEPAGVLSEAQLFSPESQILIAPSIVNFINGATSLIKYGLSDCDNGFGYVSDKAWPCYRPETDKSTSWAGNLTFVPPSPPPLAPSDNSTTTAAAAAAAAAAAVRELDVLLTSGRLSRAARGGIEAAYRHGLGNHEDGDGEGVYAGAAAALRDAQQLFVLTPEFHSTNNARPTDVDRTATTAAATATVESAGAEASDAADTAAEVAPEASAVTPPSTREASAEAANEREEVPYKAIVYLYLDGAVDSFNVLVPYSNCNSNGNDDDGGDLFAQYTEVRGVVALSHSSLLPIDASSSSQPCKTFGLHPSLAHLKTAYDQGDALFVASSGPLVEPTTKQQYESSSVQLPPSLFAHNTQRSAAQSVHASSPATAKGVLGRIRDALERQGLNGKVGSYSISGHAKVLEAVTSSPPDVVDKNSGVKTFDEKGTSSHLAPAIRNLTRSVKTSLFAEAWSAWLDTTLTRSALLSEALNNVELEQAWAADGSVGKQLKQVASLVKANAQSLHNVRDTLYVRLGGFDTHTDDGQVLSGLLADVDQGLESFKAEMVLQGMWGNVTVVQASEFGRTLTSNGLGTDHGWAGIDWVCGGAVRGGRILGHYPEDLTDAYEYNIGRGRLVPRVPLEALWSGVASWFGVAPSELDAVLPNRGNFPSQQLFDRATLFTGE